MKQKKAEIVVTRWKDDTFTVTYEGVVGRADVVKLLHAVEKDTRRRKMRSLPFSEAEKFSLA
jgi:hypothetical protein